MDYIRSTPAGLQTATHSFVNPTTEHKITIIGVQHLAHDDFWDEVNDALKEADQAEVIHFEGVAPSDNVTDPVLKEKIEVFKGIIKFVRESYALLGLTYQQDRIKHTDFVNGSVHDTNMKTVAGKLNFAQYKAGQIVLKIMEASQENSAATNPVVAEKMLQRLMKAEHDKKIAFDLFKLQKFAKRYMLDARNDIAVKAAVKETKNVTLLWGAAHIPGISAQLESEGYILTDTSWKTVIPADHKIKSNH